MSRLHEVFAAPPAAPQCRLLPYITAGYPDLATTRAILRRLEPAQCRCIELGVPFSDPIADGPVIQASFARALNNGFRLDALFDMLANCRNGIRPPLVAMVSYSIVYRRGAERFLTEAKAAGFDGLIAPDLALEEAEDLAAAARAADCPLVLMAAPTSNPKRRATIAALSDPFVYYQSVAGVTGERAALPPHLVRDVSQLRADSGKPVCVGFGISKPEHVAAVCTVADGAIVGSALVRTITAAAQRGEKPEEIAETVANAVAKLVGALTASSEPGAFGRTHD